MSRLFRQITLFFLLSVYIPLITTFTFWHVHNIDAELKKHIFLNNSSLFCHSIAHDDLCLICQLTHNQITADSTVTIHQFIKTDLIFVISTIPVVQFLLTGYDSRGPPSLLS
jgi:hypothetical protein